MSDAPRPTKPGGWTRERRRTVLVGYLRVVNPIVCILVLALCVWAATHEDGKFKPEHLFEGGFGTYFLAKGLFCSSTQFVVGKILEHLLESRDS